MVDLLRSWRWYGSDGAVDVRDDTVRLSARGGSGVSAAGELARHRAVGQPALGVERGRAAGAGSGDGLPVGVVDEVAAGEDAGDAGAVVGGALDAARSRRRRSVATWSRNSSLRGSWPIATNMPVTSSVALLAGPWCRAASPRSTLVSPCTSVTAALVTQRIFVGPAARSSMIARPGTRRGGARSSPTGRTG